MPFLKSFLTEGVQAGLRTIVPALTPPAWTSLMTGRTPGHHGVFDFFRMESPESRHIRFYDVARRRRARPSGDCASQQRAAGDRPELSR